MQKSKGSLKDCFENVNIKLNKTELHVCPLKTSITEAKSYATGIRVNEGYMYFIVIFRSILMMYSGNLKACSPRTVFGKMPTTVSSVARIAATNS